MYKRKKGGRKKVRPNKIEFEYQYYTLDMSAEQLSKIYNVKPHTIYNWATEFRNEEKPL